MSLTVGSVCSGIGAPECAWAPLGWDFLWAAEIEPFPSAVLAARFQGVANLGDMTTIAPRILAGEVAAPDVLVGGTPCQSFSIAGLRRGLADDRGNLALEFIRLADAIDAVRRDAGKPPAWILWENVPGVLSDSGNAFGAFLAGLVGDDAPLVSRGGWTRSGVVDGPGRRAAWRILDAQHFGLAQRRERVFVLARGGAGGWAAADALLPVIESLRWHPAPRRAAGEKVASTVARGSPGGRTYGLDADTADSLVAVAPTLEATAGRSRGAGTPLGMIAFGGNNTSGPIDVAAALNACPTASGRQDFESETFIAHTLRAEGFDASENGTGRGVPLIAHAFDARQSEVVQYGDRTGPLDTQGGSIGLLQAMAVRRLTPRECERLQGFPDEWTAIEYRGKPAADGPRYRALGNSMAVPVLRWIGEQIAKEDARGR